MKKILTLAAGALIGLSASLPAEAATVTRYKAGTAISEAAQLTEGQYFIYAYSKGAGRFVHKASGYMAAKGLTAIPETGTTDESYVYTITKNDNGTFTIANDGVAFSINGSTGQGRGDITVAKATETGAVAAQYTLPADAVTGQPTDCAKLFYVQLENGKFQGGTATAYFHTNNDNADGHLSYWEGTGGTETNIWGDVTNASGSSTAVAFYPITGETVDLTADGEYFRIKNTRSNKYAQAHPVDGTGRLSQIAANTSNGGTYDLGSIWYFVANDQVTPVDGYTAVHICSPLRPDQTLASVDPETWSTANTTWYISNTKSTEGVQTGYTISKGAAANDGYGWNDKSETGVCFWSNNDTGSKWLFESVTDDEVTAATTAYIESVKAIYPTIVNEENVKTPVLETLNALSGVMDTEAAVAAINAFEIGELPITTVAEANAVYSYTLPESTLSDEIRANMASSLVGNFVQIKSRVVASSGHNHPYVTVNGALDGTDLNNGVANTDDTNNPFRSIWEVVASDTEGKVCLRNVHANKYLQLNDNYNANNPISAESGAAFTVRFSTEKNGFGFDAGNSLNGDYLALHAAVDGNTGKTVKWRLSGADALNSWFDLVPVDGKVDVTTTKGDGEGEVVLNFGAGVTPAAHNEYHSETVKLIVSRVTPETPAERSVSVGTAINPGDITDGSVTLTGLTEGDYTITAPAGFFTVNGKLSAPIKQSFNVAADGTTTGINEIGVATSGKQVIYDLQGRRVQRASKGLYIINGVKTLVK